MNEMAAQQEFRPIYILKRPSVEDGPPAAVLREVGLEGVPPEPLHEGTVVRFQGGSRSLEMNREGEIWLEDTARLGSLSRPAAPPPSSSRAEALALALFDRANLMPRSNEVAAVTAPVVVNSGTRTARARRTGPATYDRVEECHTLDAYVALGPRIRVSAGAALPETIAEVVGKGAKVGV